MYRHGVRQPGMGGGEIENYAFLEEPSSKATPGHQQFGKEDKMRNHQSFSLSACFSRFSLFVAAQACLAFPGNATADSYEDYMLLERIVDSIDLSRLSEELKNLKLSAAVKMNKNGDVVVKCFNYFSLPVTHHAFDDNPGMQRLMQRTTLQVEQKGRGVMVKMAYQF